MLNLLYALLDFSAWDEDVEDGETASGAAADEEA